MPNKTTKTAKAKTSSEISTYLDKVEAEVQANQSKVSLVLGGLIVVVVGILVFNFLNKNQTAEVTPQAEETTQNTTTDVSPEGLPGKYTVKEGDTLFTIAEKYYQDGYKYSEIVKANSLASADIIEVGQVLDLPKLDQPVIVAGEVAGETASSPTPSVEPSPSPSPSAVAAASSAPKGGTGVNASQWGPAITGDKYTVVAGDWLSTIAGRAYGDIYAYEKIAKANNITNPHIIEPGTELVIPR